MYEFLKRMKPAPAVAPKSEMFFPTSPATVAAVTIERQDKNGDIHTTINGKPYVAKYGLVRNTETHKEEEVWFWQLNEGLSPEPDICRRLANYRIDFVTSAGPDYVSCCEAHLSRMQTMAMSIARGHVVRVSTQPGSSEEPCEWGVE